MRAKPSMPLANSLTRAEVQMELAESGKNGGEFEQGYSAGIYRN